MATKSEKIKKMEKFKEQANKAYKKEIVLTGQEAIDNGSLVRRVLPTPSIELNSALYGGVSGIVEFFGFPASGKTSMAIEIIAKHQREDPEFVAMWLETESSIDPGILSQHNIALDRLIYVDQKDLEYAESSLDILLGAIKQGFLDMVVVNSVAGLCPKKEVSEDLENQNIALSARLMSKALRNMVGPARKNKVTAIFINQVRTNVGQLYGDPNTTTGGRALGFYADVRVRFNATKIQASDPITADEGVKISIAVLKNRLAGQHNPYTKGTYYARYDTGIDSIISIPGELEEKGIFTRGGAHWYYPDKENIQEIAGVECHFSSKGELLDTLRNNEDFLNAVLELLSTDSLSEDEIEEIQRQEEENKTYMEKVESED